MGLNKNTSSLTKQLLILQLLVFIKPVWQAAVIVMSRVSQTDELNFNCRSNEEIRFETGRKKTLN